MEEGNSDNIKKDECSEKWIVTPFNIGTPHKLNQNISEFRGSKSSPIIAMRQMEKQWRREGVRQIILEFSFFT